MKDERIQIGEQGADIEMHVVKTSSSYFVSIHQFERNKAGKRVKVGNGTPVFPFKNQEEIHDKFGSMMAGKLVTI